MPSPVKAAAIELGLPVSHSVDDVLGVGADLGVVVAFGQLIKPHVLAELPMVNLHFSLLPRWRGAAPVERALLAGDSETGVCLMQLEEGLDTGPVYDRARSCRSARTTTADELRARAGRTSARSLLVDELRAGLGDAAAAGRRADVRGQDRALRSCRSTGRGRRAEIDRLVRLGGAWTTLRGRRLKILAAESIDRVQSELERAARRSRRRSAPRDRAARGQGPMPFDAFARGAQLASRASGAGDGSSVDDR